MNFEQGHLYHTFNQGNNRQRTFFCRENYLFFLDKIKKHVVPFADILAWCLMPNHFHLMVHVNELELPMGKSNSPSATLSRARTINRTQSFQHSIGVMLASYTRAINKQNDSSGSLFRSETKANCLTRSDKITRAWFTLHGITQINVGNPEKQYPNICFNYINFNPLKGGLVKKIEVWEFSSYTDIIGFRKGKLVNKKRIEEYGLTLLSKDSPSAT